MILRVARHTTKLNTIVKFYTEVLLFDYLGGFEDHNGYNGAFLGKNGADWHLEFTASEDEAQHSFDEDDILVFYPTTLAEYNTIFYNLKRYNTQFINAKNPYWNQFGKLFLAPDGYRIILSNLKIK